MTEVGHAGSTASAAGKAMPPKTPTAPKSQAGSKPAAWLVGDSKMAQFVREKDWSQTPLGPIESWPQSLRTVLNLSLSSNSPISIAWGAHHTQIYNDGYWPICGAKHPHSMGQDFRECWASAFPVIGEAYERAWSGQTSYLENMRMFLDRNGFLEETWFTFSFSPLRDETAGVAGLFHPVTEQTATMLSERRTSTLRELAAQSSQATTSHEALRLAAASLEANPFDVPFVLVYLVDGSQARLVASAGVPSGTAASPVVFDLAAPDSSGWPVGQVAATGVGVLANDMGVCLAGVTCGPYPEQPKAASVLPILQPGSKVPAGVLVLGFGARLALNDAYRAFHDLVGAGIAAALANARAYEDAAKKAEALAEIDRAKTAFFSNVSHEFRTPLTLMLAPIEDELAEVETPFRRLVESGSRRPTATAYACSNS